jgi:hypothetical protein
MPKPAEPESTTLTGTFTLPPAGWSAPYATREHPCTDRMPVQPRAALFVGGGELARARLDRAHLGPLPGGQPVVERVRVEIVTLEVVDLVDRHRQRHHLHPEALEQLRRQLRTGVGAQPDHAISRVDMGRHLNERS